jgi:hypothetical protein
MQYIVIWAGDIPAEARWYIERGRHGWGALAWVLYGLQGLFSFAALLSPRVRNSAKAMMALAALTLVMRLVENAWLVLPGMRGVGWAVAPLMLAASLAMLGCGWAAALALKPFHEAWEYGSGHSASGWRDSARAAGPAAAKLTDAHPGQIDAGDGPPTAPTYFPEERRGG